jgi:hypothetical protein
MYNVSRSTLTRRIRGHLPRAEASRAHAASRADRSAHILTPAEERQAVRYVAQLEEMGIDLRLNMILRIGMAIVSRREEAVRRAEKVGDRWVHAFLGRWGLGWKVGRPELDEEWERWADREEGDSDSESEDEAPTTSEAGDVEMDAPVIDLTPPENVVPNLEKAQHLAALREMLEATEDPAELKRLALGVADMAAAALVHEAMIEAMVDKVNFALAQIQGMQGEDREGGCLEIGNFTALPHPHRIAASTTPLVDEARRSN